MDTFTKWLETITGGASWRSIAEKLGTTHPTIQRRLRQDTATAAIEIANAYGASRVEALIAARVLTDADLDAYFRVVGLEQYSDLELAEDMVRRIKNARESGGESELATVTEFPDRSNRAAVHEGPSDEDIEAALLEANEGRAVAQERTDELTEPDLP